ncbi:MAG: nucleotidyltransferase domain-containing protein [Candidatus Bipolaricaulota bacterium]|nr:nucleotidyltransferase domain-containing protein [Candidatus Bipolaricaulota bacterium]
MNKEIPPRHGEGRAINFESERLRYREALERVLRALPQVFAALQEVERFWLIGSAARGRRDLFTDLDLIVVLRSTESPPTRTARLYERVASLLPLDVDVDMLTYTPEEFAQARQRGFLRRALEQGRIIYERAD